MMTATVEDQFVYLGPAELRAPGGNYPFDHAMLCEQTGHSWRGVLLASQHVPALDSEADLRLPSGEQRRVRVDGAHYRREWQDWTVFVAPMPECDADPVLVNPFEF